MTQLLPNNYQFNRECTLCFTGHRSQKLPWGFNEKDTRCLTMLETLKSKITSAIEKGYTNFLCGMALGFDMMCAETLLSLKQIYPHIKIYGALPCKDQQTLWPEKEKIRYKNLLTKLDGVRCVYERYNGSECMLERNSYMINNSSALIALFDGKQGGTKSTILKAKNQGLKICIITP